MEEYCIFDMQINPNSLSKLLILQLNPSLDSLRAVLFAETSYTREGERKGEIPLPFPVGDGGGDSWSVREYYFAKNVSNLSTYVHE